MNVLMLGRWLPPPRHPVRATREYQFARHLARSHRLTLVFVADNPDAAGSISALRGDFGDLEFASIPRGWKSLASAVRLASGESCTLSYFRSEALRVRLAERLRRTRYDLVFVSSSSMIQYALDIDRSIPIAVDFAGVDSEWWMQQAARASFAGTRFFRTEGSRLRLAETAAARRASRCVAETAEAGRIVESLSPEARVTVIQSGVDMDGFPSKGPSGKVPTVLLNACRSNEAELRAAIDFCRAVMAAVRARVPQARFAVVTKDPITAGRASRGLVGVDLVAPADLRLLLHEHTVATAPMQSGLDIRGGVLQPMAAGVPVVTSSLVREHLGARAGRDLYAADTPLDVAVRVTELLENGSQREEIGAHGRQFVLARFSWETSGRRLEELLTGVMKGTPAPDAGPEPRPIPAVRGG